MKCFLVVSLVAGSHEFLDTFLLLPLFLVVLTLVVTTSV